jgi:hypothetical protein
MLRYEYINREWIVSPTARKIYRISAGVSLALLVLWWVSIFEGISPQITPIVRPIAFAGVLGAGITLVGMEYFLFRFDASHPLNRYSGLASCYFLCSDRLSTASSFTRTRTYSRNYVASREKIRRGEVHLRGRLSHP